jgi:hypothetical protein
VENVLWSSRPIYSNFVQAAVPNVSRSSFTVHLNKAVSAGTKVAWFVVN